MASEPVQYKIPGSSGLAIIRAAIGAGSFRCEKASEQEAARKANGHGYLTRDPKDGKIWYATDKARAMLAFMAEREAALAAELDEKPGEVTGGKETVVTLVTTDAPPPVAFADASGLVQVVERARALLDEGDVIAARIVAGAAYDQAKAAGAFAERIGATERLIGKARRLQADALLIEARAKIQIADAWDAATAEGKTHKGRPKSVPDENAFSAQEAGFTRKEIHEARKLADAERKAPGIVERAIEARIEAGFEPTKASLRHAIGTRSATKEERGNNLYQTCPEAVHALLALEEFSSTVLEPACGPGALVRMLEDAGYMVLLSDLVDYATHDQFGEVQQVQDFLESEAWDENPDIVTNPPYGAVLNRFVAHALRVHRPRKMALLLNVNFFGGFDDENRNYVLDDCSPARIYWFSRRLPTMHREGWHGNEASSQMNTGWFIWEMQDDGSYRTATTIRRVDWKDFMPAEASEVQEAA